MTLKLIWVSARPWEWIKNLFIFAGLFFSQNLLNSVLAMKTFAAFALFCVASSGVYLFNDVCDREEDRQHPQKRQRPIPSGQVDATLALATASGLLLIAMGGALLLHTLFGLIVVAYLVLNLAYSRILKHVVIIDVFCIAAGFMLRVIAGAVVIEVRMSHWLLICTMLLALFLGFSKRRHELLASGGAPALHRPVLSEYDPVFLDMMIGIVTGSTVISYALYTISDETIQKFRTDKLIFTIPFVLYGIFRYLYLVYHKQEGGSPAQTILTDRPLLISVFLWSVAAGVVLYWAGPS